MMSRIFKFFLPVFLVIFVSLFFLIRFLLPQNPRSSYGDLLRLIYQIHPKTKSHFDMLTKNEFSNLEKDFDKIIEKNDLKEQQISQTEEKEVIKKPAVVIDVDATLLNNINYSVWQALENRGFDLKTWSEYVKKQNAEIFAGANHFIEKVDDAGGIVFFVSNRLGEQEGDTYLNLKKSKQSENNVDEGLMNCSYQWFFKEGGFQREKELKERTEIKPLIDEGYVFDFKTKEDRFFIIDHLKLNEEDSSDMKRIDGEGSNCFSRIQKLDDKKDDSKTKIIKSQIVMRIGDDISDFNDNFFKLQQDVNTSDFMNDDDVVNNFGSDVENTSKFFFLRKKSKEIIKREHTEKHEFYRQVHFFSNLDYGTLREQLEKDFPNYNSAKKWLKTWYTEEQNKSN